MNNKVSKYSVTVKQTEAETKNTKYLNTNSKMECVDWDSISSIPLYKEIHSTKDDLKENIVAILPYIITSKNNTWVVTDNKRIGDMSFQNRVTVHTYVGQNKKTVLCLKQMYGLPCPFCREREKMMAQNANVPEYKIPRTHGFVKGSIRDFYLIIPRVGEQAGQLCFFPASNWIFTKPFMEAREIAIRDKQNELRRLFSAQQEQLKQGQPVTGELITMADIDNVPDIIDPVNGSEVRFFIKGKMAAKTYSGFNFMSRLPIDIIPDEVLDKGVDIAEFFIRETQSSLENLLQESLALADNIDSGAETTDDDDEDKPFTYDETKDTQKAETLADTPFDGHSTEPQVAPVTGTAQLDLCPHGFAHKNTSVYCMTECPDAGTCERIAK